MHWPTFAELLACYRCVRRIALKSRLVRAPVAPSRILHGTIINNKWIAASAYAPRQRLFIALTPHNQHNTKRRLSANTARLPKCVRVQSPHSQRPISFYGFSTRNYAARARCYTAQLKTIIMGRRWLSCIWGLVNMLGGVHCNVLRCNADESASGWKVCAVCVTKLFG